MSTTSEKQVPTIEERVSASEAELRALNWRLQSQVNTSHNSILSQVGGWLRTDSENRSRALQGALSTMRGEVRDAERRATERLEAHRQATWQEFERVSEQIHATNERVEEQGRQLRREIQQSEQRLQSEINIERREREAQVQELQARTDRLSHDLNTHITNVEEEKRQQRELAQSYLDAANVLRQHIEHHLQHDRFLPGELQKRVPKIEMARELLSGSPQAALSNAAITYLDLLELRNELEMMESEWNRWRGHALESLENVRLLSRQNQRCEAVDTNNQPLGEIEVDTWAGGKLKALEQEIDSLIAQVRQNLPSATSDLQAVVSDRVPALTCQLEEIVKEARLSAIGARRRFVKLRQAVVAMEEGRAALEEHGQDWATLKRLDGSEITLRLVPGESPAQDVLDLDFRQSGMNEEDRREYAAELEGRFRDAGVIGGGSFQEVPESEQQPIPTAAPKPQLMPQAHR